VVEFAGHQIHGVTQDKFQFEQVLWVSDAGVGLDQNGTQVTLPDSHTSGTLYSAQPARRYVLYLFGLGQSGVQVIRHAFTSGTPSIFSTN
jgi:hypothetical protein